MKGATCALGGGHPPAAMLACRGRTVATTQFLWERRLVTCGKVIAQGRFQAAFKESTHCFSLVWEWLEKEGAVFLFQQPLGTPTSINELLLHNTVFDEPP